MKIKVDLSQFKLKSKDDKVAELVHPHGHTFRVAINALHPENRKNLDKLEKHEPTDKDAKVTKNDKDAVAGKPKQKMAQGGKVEIEPIEKTSKGGVKYEAMMAKDSDKPKHPVEYEAMAQGGPVVDKGPAIDPKKAKQIQDGAMESGWQPKRWAANVKEGLGLSNGGAAPMAEGGDVASANDVSSGDLQGLPTVAPTLPPEPTETEKGFFGSLTSALGGIGDAVTSGVKSASNYIDHIGQPTNTIDTSAPVSPPQAAGPQGPAEVPKTALTPAQDVKGAVENKGINIQDAYAKSMKGLEMEAKAQGSLGNKEAGLINDSIIKQQQAAKDFQDDTLKLKNERMALQKDIADGHIDPNQYVNSMSTVGRITSAIGLIASGIGSGLSGKENMAMQYLNQQIHNDIEGQKANLGKKQSLLEANYKQFGNMRDAYDMTKLQMNDTLVNQLKAAAAKAQDPLAQSRLLTTAAQKEQEMAPIQQNLDINHAMFQAAERDNKSGGGTSSQEAMLPYLRQTNPEKAKEIETRLVPGIGMAAVPVPSEARTKIIGMQNLLKSTQNMKNWVAKHGGTMDPQTVAEGRTLATELQQIYRQGVGAAGNESEKHTIEEIINSNPASLFHKFNTDPKLKALEHSMNSSLTTIKKGYGLPTQSAAEQLSPRQQQLLDVARRNPNHPNSQKIIQQLGGGR